jgi:hypothetical protein
MVGPIWVQIHDAITGAKNWSDQGIVIAGTNPCAFAPDGRLFAAPIGHHAAGATKIAVGIWRINLGQE